MAVDNQKAIEKVGPFAGLWVRTERALAGAGYMSGPAHVSVVNGTHT